MNIIDVILPSNVISEVSEDFDSMRLDLKKNLNSHVAFFLLSVCFVICYYLYFGYNQFIGFLICLLLIYLGNAFFRPLNKEFWFDRVRIDKDRISFSTSSDGEDNIVSFIKSSESVIIFRESEIQFIKPTGYKLKYVFPFTRQSDVKSIKSYFIKIFGVEPIKDFVKDGEKFRIDISGRNIKPQNLQYNPGTCLSYDPNPYNIIMLNRLNVQRMLTARSRA